MKHTLLRRALSILVTLAMMAGLIPTIVLPVAAGYVAGDIAGTTGGGMSAADPVVCDSFAELKAALEHNDIRYLKLVSGSYTRETLPDPAVANEPAIVAVADKYLTLAGHKTFVSSVDKKYDSLIRVDGHLTIDGSGSLTYEHNYYFGTGSVVSLVDSEAQLHIKGEEVSLTGQVDTRYIDSDKWAFGRAVHAGGGALRIEGGNFYGHVYDGPGVQSYMHRSALFVAYDAQATIEGGLYRSVRTYNSDSPMNSHACGATFAPNDPDNITISGGTFYGMYITGADKELSAYLDSKRFYYDETDHARFNGDKKESPATEYTTSGGENYHEYHPITVESYAGATAFGSQNPTPTVEEAVAGVTDCGTVYLGTASMQQLFYFIPKELPGRVKTSSDELRCSTTVLKNGEEILKTDSGDTVNLKNVATEIGSYTVVQTIDLYDLINETTADTVSHEFLIEVDYAPIEKIVTGIFLPDVGEYPADATVNNEHVDVLSTMWSVYEDGEWSAVANDEALKNGKTYRVTVSVSTDDGYVFAEGVTAVINNKAAMIVSASANRVEYYIEYETEPATLTSIAITVPPSVTTFLEGDSVRFDGMVVTAYFADGTSRDLAWGEYELPQGLVAHEEMTSFEVSYNFRGVVKTATQTISVTPANYAMAFLGNPTMKWDIVLEGYGPVSYRYFTLKNVGDQKVGVTKFTLSGSNADCFTLSTTQIAGLQPGWEKTISVQPKTGLTAGTYTATVTAVNDECSASVNLVFEVSDGVTVSGTVFADGTDGHSVTVRLYEEGTPEPAYETVVSGLDETPYSIDRVLPGTYTMEVLRVGFEPVAATIVVDYDDVTVDFDMARLPDVGPVNVTVDGYDMFSYVLGLQVTSDNPYVTVESSGVVDEHFGAVTEGGFAPETTYALVVVLSPAEGYAIDTLAKEDCTSFGQTAVLFSYSEDDNTVTVLFFLPVIPTNIVGSVEFMAEGYVIGGDIANFWVTESTEGIGVVASEVYDNNGNRITEGTFEADTTYRVRILAPLEAGYKQEWKYEDLIMYGATLDTVSIDDESGMYSLVFVMDPLVDKAEVIRGDINFDGKVNVVDSMLLFAATSGRATLSGQQNLAADMNSDGKVNVVDSVLLFKQVSGR